VRRPRLVWGGRIAVALGVLYGAVLAWVYHASRDDQRRPVGALVVLGAAHYNGRPSPVLRSRLDHALTLFRQGLAPRLVVTGGTRAGDSESEAAVQRRFLLEHDVADSAVVVIDAGRTTEETMVAVAAWFRRHAAGDALLVSDGFHLARLRLEAQRNSLTAYTTPTPASPIAKGSRREWMFLAREALKVPVAALRALVPAP
jgi:uncharacterized SAM-binding protein YcdF (DUF218 family)